MSHEILPREPGPILIYQATTTVDANPHVIAIPTWAQKLGFSGIIKGVGEAAGSSSLELAPNNVGGTCRAGAIHSGATAADFGALVNMRLAVGGGTNTLFESEFTVGPFVNGGRQFRSEFLSHATGAFPVIETAGTIFGVCLTETWATIALARSGFGAAFKAGSYVELYAWVPGPVSS